MLLEGEALLIQHYKQTLKYQITSQQNIDNHFRVNYRRINILSVFLLC